MALFKFTKAFLGSEKTQVFKYFMYRRDFTYINDFVEVVIRVLDSPVSSNPGYNSDNPALERA
jgi:UDP-glucuronate 4-epimerase